MPSAHAKPLMVIPPAASHWPGLELLLADASEAVRRDLERRLTQQIPRANDAIVVVPDGARRLGCGVIRRCGDIGALGQLYVQPEQRLRGHATRILQALLSWFDMTGGRWLYVQAPPTTYASFLINFGFQPIVRSDLSGADHIALLRRPGTVLDEPVAPEHVSGQEDQADVRPVSSAELPWLVALLSHRPGPDPRVSLEQSAGTAEQLAMDLVDQSQRNLVALLMARRGERLVAAGSVALDSPGPKTYAMVFPPRASCDELRAALQAEAVRRGFERVDFPFEALPDTPAASSS